MNITGLPGNWTCTVELHDHPDLLWEIDESTAGELINSWENLPASTEHAVKGPQPGYMGCCLKSSNEEWHTYRGLVTYYLNGMIKTSKRDKKRIFEKSILSTIPHTAE